MVVAHVVVIISMRLFTKIRSDCTHVGICWSIRRVYRGEDAWAHEIAGHDCNGGYFRVDSLATTYSYGT